jgi:hypothetical protein
VLALIVSGLPSVPLEAESCHIPVYLQCSLLSIEGLRAVSFPVGLTFVVQRRRSAVRFNGW